MSSLLPRTMSVVRALLCTKALADSLGWGLCSWVMPSVPTSILLKSLHSIVIFSQQSTQDHIRPDCISSHSPKSSLGLSTSSGFTKVCPGPLFPDLPKLYMFSLCLPPRVQLKGGQDMGINLRDSNPVYSFLPSFSALFLEIHLSINLERREGPIINIYPLMHLVLST